MSAAASALPPAPATVPATAPAAVPAPAPASPGTASIGWWGAFLRFFIFSGIFDAAFFTYFCASELSKPWGKSQIPVVITLVALSIINVILIIDCFYRYVIKWLPWTATTRMSDRLNDIFNHVFNPFFIVACFSGTYIAAHELSRPWEYFHIGIIFAMVPLGLYNLCAVMFIIEYTESIRECVRLERKAKRKWTSVSLIQRIRVTREQVQAQLERDIENANRN